MNNINIKNIFDNNYTKTLNGNKDNNDDNYSIKNINVKTFIPVTNLNKINGLTDDFIISKIKYNEDTEKKKLIELYDLKYNECLIKISNGIDVGVTDIFYKVSDAFFGYKFYKPKDCLSDC